MEGRGCSRCAALQLQASATESAARWRPWPTPVQRVSDAADTAAVAGRVQAATTASVRRSHRLRRAAPHQVARGAHGLATPAALRAGAGRGGAGNREARGPRPATVPPASAFDGGLARATGRYWIEMIRLTAVNRPGFRRHGAPVHGIGAPSSSRRMFRYAPPRTSSGKVNVMRSPATLGVRGTSHRRRRAPPPGAPRRDRPPASSAP